MITNIRQFLKNSRDFLAGRSAAELLYKGHRLLRREGYAGLHRLISNIAGAKAIRYNDWISLHDTLTDKDRRCIDRHIKGLQYQPLISILMPVYNPPVEFLSMAIASVRRQIYPNWELCIADDASTDPGVLAVLKQSTLDDSRIHVTFRQTNGHISVASNTALAMARGEFIALLDHDDELSEHALYLVAAALSENPNLDLLYSDEDKIDAKGQRFGHYFKPDWNPDLFFSQNLICHLSVYRREIVNTVGGFREFYDGALNWDLALRFVDVIHANKIGHIPHVLYHLRATKESQAIDIEGKQCAAVSSRNALEDHWHRQGIAPNLVDVEGGHFITHLPLPLSEPRVSIIICTRNRVDLLRQCMDGLGEKTTYTNYEVIIVDNGSDDYATSAYLAELSVSKRARIINHPHRFNFAELNNIAVQHANGDLICLMNNDVIPIASGWLAGMVAHALRLEIGAVGAKLLYPNDTIQHAGVLLNGIAAGHLHLGYRREAAGYGSRAILAQNVSAVTAACLVIRKRIWDEVCGMDESYAVAFNDVDFCLRVGQLGYRNLWLPQAELYHYESASRGMEDTPEKRARYAKEIELLQKRWGNLLGSDPAWNPNLALSGERIGLASPPRCTKPWLEVDAG